MLTHRHLATRLWGAGCVQMYFYYEVSLAIFYKGILLNGDDLPEIFKDR